MRGRIVQKLKTQVQQFIENSDIPVCIGDVAKHFGIAWSTARQILMELLFEGKVEHQRTTTSTFFWRKRKGADGRPS